MKLSINNISVNDFHKAFESRIRLGIMSVLAVNDVLDFNSLKEYLDITDGNLASHIKTLEKEKFIGVKKSFVGKKPNTRYFMTKEGKKAFDSHLSALEKFIKSQK
ncbi:MAG TPA: transcriptional regulator [Flavitalea sp.]|nr:transcriptional regulator [Flavitalea sp.]